MKISNNMSTLKVVHTRNYFH